MVYRNFADQLSPDAYFVNAMWSLLAMFRADAANSSATRTPRARRVIFHIFSEQPPRDSWTGTAKVNTLSEPRSERA